jgi:Tfp pilus assembly protein PilO
MKNASFLVMAGVVCLAFGGSTARASEAQDPADELRLLRSENKMVKAALETKNKKLAELEAQLADAKKPFEEAIALLSKIMPA